jgi:hypothetical protein
MFGLNAKQILLLLLLIVGLFAASQIVPIYFNAFQFSDYIKQEVRFAAASRRTPDDIRVRIVEKAKEFEFPIGPKDVRITRRGPAFNLEINYAVPLDLRLYRREIAFHIFESGELYDR